MDPEFFYLASFDGEGPIFGDLSVFVFVGGEVFADEI